MNYSKDQIIGEIVAADYRSATVFKNYNIDFCCQGNRSIESACEAENLETDKLLQELEAINNTPAGDTIDFKSWPLDLLADYVEKKHHRYVEKQIPVVKQYLQKIVQVHGAQHPELAEIQEHFHASASELSMHMKKEELILFPLIRKIVAGANGTKKDAERSVSGPIQKMMAEHDQEGERFREIAKLSDNYNPPADACNTYVVTFGLLKEFEDDLHLHIHLENNILFPSSIQLEKQDLN